MKVVVLYRPNSGNASAVDEFVRNFLSRTNNAYPVEQLNADSRDGAALASLYDVMQYPAILVLQTDGYMQQMWSGETLPMVDEVIAYSRA